MTDLQVTYRGVIVPDRYHNNLDRAEFANFKVGVDAALGRSNGLRTAKHIYDKNLNLKGSPLRFEQPYGEWLSGDPVPVIYPADEAEHFISDGVWEILTTNKENHEV